MKGWRPALRIARRSVRRNFARSVLIAVLVAVPVAGATMVDVVYRTFDSPEQQAQEQIGSADAQVIVTRAERLTDYTPLSYGEEIGAVGETGRDRRRSTSRACCPRARGSSRSSTRRTSGSRRATARSGRRSRSPT